MKNLYLSRVIQEMNQQDQIKLKFLTFRDRNPEQALELLMNNYGDAMTGIVNQILKDGSQTEDVLQEGFIKVWKNLNSYDPNRSSIFSWLLTIIRNTAIDNLRNRGNKKNLMIDSTITDSIQWSEHSTIRDHALLERLNQLEPQLKELIHLIYFKAYTQQEVADELKIPLGTVKTRIGSAIKTLRKILNLIILILR